MDLYNFLKISREKLINLRDLPNKEYKDDKAPLKLSFGTKNFDEILAGGFNFDKKYLIFGANKTGKTQICHQICVQAFKQYFMDSESNLPKNIGFIYYFDTENTFRPERIKDLATHLKINYSDILKNILISQIMSNSAFLISLNNLEKILEKDQSGILIIDSINNHFRAEQGDKNISYQKSKEIFLKILRKLNDLNNKYPLCIIATAQISPNLLKDNLIQEIPVGNQFLNLVFSEYLYLKYYMDGICFVQIVDSNFLPEKKLFYKITSSGIKDYKL